MTRISHREGHRKAATVLALFLAQALFVQGSSVTAGEATERRSEMENSKTKRIVKKFAHRINASPERIFPLLCPVREYEWIDGWSSELVYSESGLAEKHCVFETHFPHAGRQTWMVSRYDPDRFAIEFVITQQESHIEKLELSVEDNGDGTSTLNWTRVYTGLNEKGAEFIEKYAGDPLSQRMERIGKALDHYCRTGKMLREETSPTPGG